MAREGLAPIKVHERLAREKKDLAFFHGQGMGRVVAAGENRHLGKRLAGAEDMEDLFLAVDGQLENFDLAVGHHEEAFTAIAFGENGLAPFELPSPWRSGQERHTAGRRGR